MEPVEDEARRRFAWAFPPESYKEDAERWHKGREPRDWEPTRRACIEDVTKDRWRSLGLPEMAGFDAVAYWASSKQI